MNVTISYNDENRNVFITNGSCAMDVSRISGMEISEWISPFMIKDKRWSGLPDELKNYYNADDFEITFFGSEESRAVLAGEMKNYGVSVSAEVKSVTVLCKSDDKVVITINGKPMDTSRLKNRTIDEWMLPFRVKDIEWMGLFSEIERETGAAGYNMKFVGSADSINLFKSQCPLYVPVTYKELIPDVSSNTMTNSVNTVPENQKVQYVPAESKPEKYKETSHSTSSEIKTSFSNPESDSFQAAPEGILNKIRKFFSDCKTDYFRLKKEAPELNIIALVGYGLTILGCLYSMISMQRIVLYIALVPAMVFTVIFYVKNYKKTALFLFLASVLLFIVSWLIVTLRWRNLANEMFEGFDGMSDSLNDLNDMFDQYHEAMDSINK